MAIWQVPICLVNLFQQPICANKTLINSIQELQAVFPEEKSWSPSIRQFGYIDSTCIEFDMNCDDFGNEIAVRLDIRNITPFQLQAICNFASRNGFYIQQNDGLLEPNIENFMAVIEASRAKQFLSNPVEFFRNLEKN